MMMTAARVRNLSRAAGAASVLGLIAVFALRAFYNQRFVGPVPTLAFIFVPLMVFLGIQRLTVAKDRRNWLAFGIGPVIFIGLLVYVSVTRS